MTRSWITVATIAVAGLFHANSCEAQVMDGQAEAPNFYAAPGFYGTTYGSASYKVPRRYSLYSSMSGAGYSMGYPPATFISGSYGMGLWRPDAVAKPGMTSSLYSTFTIVPGPGVALPPIGYYAPGYGPGPVPSPR